MKFTNSYNLSSTFNFNGNLLGKGLNVIKNIFTNAVDKDSVSGGCVMNCKLSGEMSVEVSTEELIELYKEYGDDFNRQIKFLKEELRPCIKECMGAIDDSAKSFQKTLHEYEDLERIHDERVKAESEAREWEEKAKAAKEKKSE